MNPQTLIALIPLLPLVGFIINGVGFRKLPKLLVSLVAVGASLSAFVITLLLFNHFLANGSKPITAHFFTWISVANLNINFSFLIDQLSLLMLLVVTGVGSLIHIYSIGYMGEDEGFGKFMAFLNLFMFSMLLLVLGSNYVIMFIGWEGVGLCSYLLIGFWNKNTDYNYAARKAFVMNRIGDLGFLLGIFLLIQYFGSVEYSAVFPKAVEMFKLNDTIIVAITLLLFVGAMGKSAQLPLYTWLPDAMAGPTPVSALIHAATMVTAGIYMVVRSNVLYTLAPFTLSIVAIVGLATALLAASIGIFQNDIKKVLAYSTVSQLGYMFLGLGVMAYNAAMFHVITHAFFKALLFLGAGSVIHALHHEQDMRNMGGLSKHIKITFVTFLIGTIAIAGIPPFAGFFSKDEILMHVFEKSPFMWVLAVIGAAMTSFYMFRLLFVTFLGKFRGTHEQEHHLHESPSVMTIPLVVLALLSIVGGFIGIPAVFAENSHWLANFMNPLFELSKKVNPEAFGAVHLSHTQEFGLMGASVGVSLISLVLAYMFFVSQKKVPAPDEQVQGFAKVVYNKYYIDEIYNFLIANPLQKLSVWLHDVYEKYVVDMFVQQTGSTVTEMSDLTRRTQTGQVSMYVLFMVLGMVVVLVIQFFG